MESPQNPEATYTLDVRVNTQESATMWFQDRLQQDCLLKMYSLCQGLVCFMGCRPLCANKFFGDYDTTQELRSMGFIGRNMYNERNIG